MYSQPLSSILFRDNGELSQYFGFLWDFCVVFDIKLRLDEYHFPSPLNEMPCHLAEVTWLPLEAWEHWMAGITLSSSTALVLPCTSDRLIHNGPMPWPRKPVGGWRGGGVVYIRWIWWRAAQQSLLLWPGRTGLIKLLYPFGPLPLFALK